MKIKYNNKGFTLVELVVSMAVFAIATVAISSILVCAIRYSGLSFKEEANLREVITIERVLEAAVKDANKVESLMPKELVSGEMSWEIPSNGQNDQTDEGGKTLLRIHKKESTEFYEFLIIRENDAPSSKIWYRVSSETLNVVPDISSVENDFGFCLLSEKVLKRYISVAPEEKTLEFMVRVGSQSVQHTLHRFWNIGVEKTAAGAI